MTRLSDALADYLMVRRTLGYKLEFAERFLPDLIADIEAAHAPSVTTELAVRWATKVSSPVWSARRLAMVRPFARHLQALIPETEVPPNGLLPYRISRGTPYIYSDADVAALMSAARSLQPAFKAATMEAFIGLMAVTGMRCGEAVALRRSDVNLDTGMLTVWNSKFRKSRLVPVHPTCIAPLTRYAAIRDAQWPAPSDETFLLSWMGARINRVTLAFAFVRIIGIAGLETPGRPRPRPHDFRHTFAVHTLLDWYRAGVDVNQQMPVLSTYLGHSDPAHTYWYVSATPELLMLAAERSAGVWEGTQ
jgi:integrase/recombinase XerD